MLSLSESSPKLTVHLCTLLTLDCFDPTVRYSGLGAFASYNSLLRLLYEHTAAQNFYCAVDLTPIDHSSPTPGTPLMSGLVRGLWETALTVFYHAGGGFSQCKLDIGLSVYVYASLSLFMDHKGPRVGLRISP